MVECRSLKNEITFFNVLFALAYIFRKCFQIRNIIIFYLVLLRHYYMCVTEYSVLTGSVFYCVNC